MKQILPLLLLSLFSPLFLALPLDDYVNLPDNSYKWEVARHVENEKYDFYALKLVSQTWTFVETDRPTWEHWVRICIPRNIGEGKNALIYINGGGNPLGNPPSSMEDFLPPIALSLGDIVVELNQIPNQPLVFAGETEGRKEDSLLAKSWDIFIQTREPYTIARLPMVKSVVKAMDCVQEFVSSLKDLPVPSGFLLSGGSKRGWVTWLAGAVDKRVVGVAPLVIDVLDMNPNFNEIYQTYGRWPVALQDYTNQNVTRCLNCPAFRELAQVEDPLVYLDRFLERNIPIFAINACGDEFFIPTGWKWWYGNYKGEKYLRYMPNAEHSLATAIVKVVNTLSTFTWMIDHNIERPQFSWELNEDLSQITIHSEVTPKSVKLWQAYNRRSRAFIVNCYLTCLWTSTDVPTQGNGVYVAKIEIPKEGFLGFMVEVEYSVGFQETFVSGTGVTIVPDVFEHPPCPDSKCSLCDTC